MNINYILFNGFTAFDAFAPAEIRGKKYEFSTNHLTTF